MKTETNRFNRFKYAEEFAYRADVLGRFWRMSREEDETYEEDGQTYSKPVYLVEVYSE